MDKQQVIAALEAACRSAGSQSAWAGAHGISAPYVGDVLNGRRDPGEKILAALKIERVVTYRRIKGKADG